MPNFAGQKIKFALFRSYLHDHRLDQLAVVDISKAQAQQRGGRAGRTGPGVCYRLYSEQKHAEMPDESVPEIHRSNLSRVLLSVFSKNIKLSELDLLDQPESKCWLDALFELHALRLVDFPAGASSQTERPNFFEMAPADRLR